ncbi:glutathione hydrolase 1 proenzyme-like [Danio aesculapii]|uniref:glutathione hydrolase 1 proenzyme-like n=1 Tax=Danio aesculapii TaxID=1142201 RepID=UPI0024BF619B|nr:glutathione hydrolase 1 proenzyme-like [Danio aesculapii]
MYFECACICSALVIVIAMFLLVIRSLNPKCTDNCYRNAAVATDAETCSDIGRDILKRGGSAVDAAIAALLCVSVVNPQSMGIGGGVVFNIYNASTGKLEIINARETAPMSATANMLGNKPQTDYPGLLIAVPGELRGYKMAHDRHGRLPWKELFEPSIELAWKGFQIGAALANAINETKKKFLKNTTLCEVFCDADYNLPKKNDYIRFSQLAATYRKIAEEGPDAFYNGSLTKHIVDDIRAAGGNITHKDLEDYEAELTEYALNFTVGKYTFYAPTAPFGGPVLALIMKLLGNECVIEYTDVILNYLYFDYNLTKAVNQPRVQITENATCVDDDFDEGVIDGLKERNHTIIVRNTEDSVVQAIGREGDKICAASDFRKDGKPNNAIPNLKANTIRQCRLLYIFIAFLVAMVLFLTPTQRSAVMHTPRSILIGTPTTPNVTVTGNCDAKAAVAADSDTCSEIGRDILSRNGSAVDAAIAALLCVSVINPHSMGIGGGVVFTIYNALNGTVETINARETAPMNATENMFVNKTCKKYAGLYIAVPGELRGYEMAHERHGKLPWKELFQPSIKLASEGFKIGKALARAINEKKEKYCNFTALCEVFCDSNNTLLKENDTIRFPKLAETYRNISEEGADAFYSGSLTEDIVNTIKNKGGNITPEDLKHYKAELNESTLSFNVSNYTFHAPTAPFGGPVLALILNILLGKGFNLTNKSMSTTENKTLTYHRIIEAFRFADAQKKNLSDPLSGNSSQFVKNMISDSFADHIRSLIKDDHKQISYSVEKDNGTSHLSVLAEDGSAVAVTSSINNYFGSCVMSDSGIIFNDQMADFIDSDMKSEANKIEPGKRPLSSMCPTIIFDKDDSKKKVRMVVGGSGGTTITTSVAQVILNYLIFGYDLQKAVAEPRVQIAEKWTHVEEGFDECVIAGLEKRKHCIDFDAALSKVQVVARQGDKICAVSDQKNGGFQMLSTAFVFLLLSTIFSHEIAVQ